MPPHNHNNDNSTLIGTPVNITTDNEDRQERQNYMDQFEEYQNYVKNLLSSTNPLDKVFLRLRPQYTGEWFYLKNPVFTPCFSCNRLHATRDMLLKQKSEVCIPSFFANI